jgi:hypothetical protein
VVRDELTPYRLVADLLNQLLEIQPPPLNPPRIERVRMLSLQYIVNGVESTEEAERRRFREVFTQDEVGTAESLRLLRNERAHGSRLRRGEELSLVAFRSLPDAQRRDRVLALAEKVGKGLGYKLVAPAPGQKALSPVGRVCAWLLDPRREA